MGKNALITGASSGIGRELALLMSSECEQMALVARDLAALSEVAGQIRKSTDCTVHIIEADLAAENAAKKVFEKLSQIDIFIDILVNNAGAGLAGPFISHSAADNHRIINLNITSLVDLCSLFGQAMSEKKHGSILNVASTGAFQPGPYTAVYYASKSFTYSFTLALANELKDSGVQVSVLCPGATKTSFSSRAGKADLRNAMRAEKVAQAAWNGLRKGKSVIIPGLQNKAAVFLSKILPDQFNAAIVRKIQQKQYYRFRDL